VSRGLGKVERAVLALAEGSGGGWVTTADCSAYGSRQSIARAMYSLEVKGLVSTDNKHSVFVGYSSVEGLINMRSYLAVSVPWGHSVEHDFQRWIDGKGWVYTDLPDGWVRPKAHVGRLSDA
jgi:hypothetical protein